MKVSLKGIQSERRSFWAYTLCFQFIITEDIQFHTFPLRPFFEARISGAGMGGRDIASLIISPEMGVWSREYPVFCNVVCFLCFIGVSGELCGMT